MTGESRVRGRFFWRRRNSDDKDLDPGVITSREVKVVTFF